MRGSKNLRVLTGGAGGGAGAAERQPRRRRSFFGEAIRASVGFCGAGAVVTACGGQPAADDDIEIVAFPAALNGKVQIDVKLFTELKAPGGAVIGRPGGLMEPIMVVRKPDSQYVVLGALCTHQSCPLAFNAASETMDCNCHGSSFELDGSVINGPAVIPLKVYPSQLDGQILTVTMAG